MISPYTYKARVLSVYDGDTIRVEIDLGFGLKWSGDGKGVQIRLHGINSPEMRGNEKNSGVLSRDWLRKEIDGKDIILKTIKDSTEKYGRYLGVIFTIEGKNINESLVSEGLAIKKEY
jgi:micrococcal nuclease